MRRAWVSLAAAALVGCAQGSSAWVQVVDTVRDGGIEMVLLEARLDDRVTRWRWPPARRHCILYVVRVQSTDGRRHEMRPDDFQSEGQTPGQAVGRCNSAQLEPVWIDSQTRVLSITILEGSDTPAPLFWHPRS